MPNIIQPPTLQGDAGAQLTQVYRYLFRLSEQLNMALGETDRQVQYIRTNNGGAVDEDRLTSDLDRQYRDLKSLIIKTADVVRAEMDVIVTQLDSKYLAISDWGTYREEVSREITDTAKHTIENFKYGEEIFNIPDMVADFEAYRIEAEGYIKRGIIGYDDENFPVIGIAIGQTLRSKTVVIDGVEYQEFDTSENMATYAAEKLSFWINGVEVARLSNSELVVTRAVISDSIQLGDWNIEVNAQDGMTVQKRVGDALDLSGNNTINVTAEKINAVADQIDLSVNAGFKSVAGKADENARRLTSAESAITQQAGQIQTKVSSTDFDALTGRVTTAESSITQNANDITLVAGAASNAQSTASAAQTAASNAQSTANAAQDAADIVNSKIENLAIGGRNLLLNSGTERRKDSYLIAKYTLDEDWVEGDAYVLSIWGDRQAGGFAAFRDDGWRSISLDIPYDASAGCYRVKFVCPAAYDATRPTNVLSVYNYPNTVPHDSVIRRIQLERGNRATEWSPNPADLMTHVGANPPAAPIATDKQWLDTSVTPPVLRSWVGTEGTNTAVEFDGSTSRNPIAIDNARILSVDQLHMGFSPKQFGSGTPSPTNIRALIPLQKMGLRVSGKNLLDFDHPYYASTRIENTPSISYARETSGRSYSVPANSKATWAADRFMWFLPAGTYTISAKMHSSSVNYSPVLSIYTGETLKGNYTWRYSLSENGNRTLTMNKPFYISLYIHATRDTTVAEAYTVRYYDIQIELGDQATEFEAFRGKRYEQEFGEQIYGANVSPIDGSWAQTYKYVEFDGTENWAMTTPSGLSSAFVLGGIPAAKSGANQYASHYADKSAYSTPDDLIMRVLTSQGVWARDKRYSTVEAWKAYLAAQKAAGTPVQIAYELETKIMHSVPKQAPLPVDGVPNIIMAEAGAWISLSYTASGWRTVNDTAQLQAVQAELAERQALVEAEQRKLGMAITLDSEGLHVHRPYDAAGGQAPPCETLTTDKDFNIVVNRKTQAKFAARTMQLGEMQLRIMADGSLAVGSAAALGALV